jgi:c-di-GMP-binding flagellar brake protein YcgR
MTKQEKRKHARISSLNLSYVCLDENNQVIKQGMGRSLNVSESGILLETHFPIDDQHIVRMTLGLEEDLIDVKGRPVHTRMNNAGKYEVGLEFVKSDAKTRKALKKFIDTYQEKGE